MISKKSRKVIAAVLIGATVCASGTFAYFNAKTDLSNIGKLDENAQKTLNITNGKIVIQGKMAGVEGTALTSLWGYDVARVSTINSLLDSADTNFKTAISDAYGYTSANVLDSSSKFNLKAFNTAISGKKDYIITNESPDILGLADIQSLDDAVAEATTNLVNAANALGGTSYGPSDINAIKAAAAAFPAVPTTQQQAVKDAIIAYDNAVAAQSAGVLKRTTRAKVGTGVTGAIINARPGDAFALGAVKDDNNDIDMDVAGITIDNQSNLTTKIGIRLKPDDDGNYTETIKQIKSMNANGWKVYIKVIDPTNSNAGISPFAEWTEITEASFTPSGSDPNPLVDSKYTCAVTNVAPGQAAPTVQMRVELPLDTVNYYQDRQTGNGVAGLYTDFDLTNLFEIVATQENNPGWNENGSTSVPVTVSDTSTPVTP